MRMLTYRQKIILKELLEQKGTYVKSAQLAEAAKVSTKTVHSDMKALTTFFLHSSTQISSQSGKGYKLESEDELALRELTDCSDKLFHDTDTDFTDQSTRVKYIMHQLMNSEDFILSEDLADHMYLSRSRITADLKIVRKIFAEYHLDILSKPGYGICVRGSEQDKRMCIVKEHIPIFEQSHAFLNEQQLLQQIGDVIMDVLIQYHYKVSDLVFQNIVAHLAVAVKRIYDDHAIHKEEVLKVKEIAKGHEFEIASAIMTALERAYGIQINQDERTLLAISLQGKRNYDSDIIISEEIDHHVWELLKKIKQHTGFDMRNDTDLRLSLALHVMPLLTRARYSMMLKNSMKQEIKKSFPLAYEMAIVGACYLHEAYKITLNEDEIAYLAVHFSIGLEKYSEKQNPKKVLIISSSRQGETLLLQRQFIKWFGTMLDELKIVNYIDLDKIQIEKYEAVFTTSMIFDSLPSHAVKINYFMNKRDYDRIYKILNNESSMEDLLQYFHEDLMTVLPHAESKEEVIRILCRIAADKFDLGDELLDAVLRREELGFTSFENYIAVPHPDHLFTEETFVVVCLLDQPILWGEEQVRIVLLVNVAKNQEQELRVIFQAVSRLISDPEGIREILKEKTFSVFMNVLHKVIEHNVSIV